MNKPIFLLVDDNRINLMILRQFIDKEQFEIKEVSGLKDAIEFCETHSPTYLISDINFLDGTGWDLIDYIRNNESLKNIICIATSASTQALQNPENQLKDSSKGFDIYLPKPFTKEKLWNLINKIEK